MEKLLIIDSSSFVLCSNITRVEYVLAIKNHNWNGETYTPAGMKIYENNGEQLHIPCSKDTFDKFQEFLPLDSSTIFKI